MYILTKKQKSRKGKIEVWFRMKIECQGRLELEKVPCEINADGREEIGIGWLDDIKGMAFIVIELVESLEEERTALVGL